MLTVENLRVLFPGKSQRSLLSFFSKRITFLLIAEVFYEYYMDIIFLGNKNSGNVVAQTKQMAFFTTHGWLMESTCIIIRPDCKPYCYRFLKNFFELIESLP